MKQPKWTSGTWRVVKDETITVRDDNDASIASLGWLTNRNAGPRRTSAEVHANAYLCAAGPEMYEAGFQLTQFKPEHDPTCADHTCTCGATEAWKKMMAALAKARGET